MNTKLALSILAVACFVIASEAAIIEHRSAVSSKPDDPICAYCLQTVKTLKEQISDEKTIDQAVTYTCATFKTFKKLEENCEKTVGKFLHDVVNNVKSVNERDVCVKISLCPGA